MEGSVIKELLEKYRLGTCTGDEKILVENWYLAECRKAGTSVSPEDMNGSRNRMARLITENTGVKINHKEAKRILLWPRITAAASILLFLFAGSYFIWNKYGAKGTSAAVIAYNDIKPGGNSAILTLGDGKTILLNKTAKGQLAVQGGMAVTKTADGQIQYQTTAEENDKVMFNTITTRRKEQYEVILADGTRAWLNASSSIKYPSAFKGNDREVVTTGEVYFEVAHNAFRPFKVTSGGQTIQVLGTHFNVNAYGDEPELKTTLLEGSVKVTAANSFRIIKPGEQTVLHGDNLSVTQVNTEEAVAWKNGYFRFDQEKIGSIMRKLSRWYDIDVDIDGPVPDDEFSGTISRSTNISEVLNALGDYKTVHFKIEGRRVTVSK